MSLTAKHSFVSLRTNKSNAGAIGGDDWNANHVFGGGAHGGVLYRNTGSTTGADWVTAADGILSCDGSEQTPSFVKPYVRFGASITGTPTWAVKRPRVLSILDTMESGWSAHTAGGTYTHEAGAGALAEGTVLKIVTSSTAISATARSPLYGTTKDISGGDIGIWIKVDDLTKLEQLWLQASSDDFATNNLLWNITIPTGAYPFLIPEEWALVTLSLEEAAETGTVNTAAINRFRIRAFSTTATGATVRIDAIASIARPQSAGAVSITFDDSHATQFTAARPVMDVYGFPATAYNIVSLVGSTGYTLAQAQQLHRIHGWEMAAHALSLDYHPPGLLNTQMTEAQLHENFGGIRNWLLDNGFGGGADHYAFPGGAYNRDVLDIVQQYFASARTIASMATTSGPVETYPPADPHRLRVLNVLDTTATSTVTNAIDRAVAGDHWLILVFHQIVTTPAASTQYSTANFTTVIDHLFTSGIAVRTVGDVLKHGL